jgi:hypothetical protein
MFGYDPITNLRHWPTPMARYGKTPFGDNLYRIVLAESRRHLVGGGRHGRAYQWVQTYPRQTAAWILERWQMPHVSKRTWEEEYVCPMTGFPLLGPYPARGEYFLAWEFDKGVTADNLDQVVAAVEKGRERSFQDVRDNYAEEYDYEEKATATNIYEEHRDVMTAFGRAPIAGHHVQRNTKTAPDLVSANELGLPIPRAGGRRPSNGPLQLSTSLINLKGQYGTSHR